ncbi:MAG: T9SS type A sorting domain-containing protein, partial [Crocinitomicaceae bacterium]|nr:T9SS type A sorting domain-containing protein [Crocinitomicaceae bacterium]
GFQNLEEQLHETFIMYPNPANTSITIDGINYESGSLSDLSGRIVKTWGGYSNKIDITELTPGIYIVTVYRNNEIVGLQKLIIQ